MSKNNNIRNFCIIAHVDHGKSTLADRLLEITHTIPKEKMREQYLDQNPIERERGITIKLAPVRMVYTYKTVILNGAKRTEESPTYVGTDIRQRSFADAQDDNEYVLNLIDTPGHVDFSYEVSRSLAAVEGAILLVDATSGIQAQTISNMRQARKQGLTIIPVVNKIDLPHANSKKTGQDMVATFGFGQGELLFISAKTGQHVLSVIEAIIDRIPPPQGEIDTPLKALTFDSQYDPFKGVVGYLRIFEGQLRKGEKIAFMGSGARAQSVEVGIFTPQLQPTQTLSAGEIGYVATGLKDVAKTRVGDTLTSLSHPTSHPVAGYREVKPMVFAAFYPTDSRGFPMLRDALTKLSLNDASLSFEQEYSEALGGGFRIGFLGLLHREIVEERLEREYNLSLIASLPTVEYDVETTKGEMIKVRRPGKLPHPSLIKAVNEPYIRGKITTPKEYVGGILELLASKRGQIQTMEYQGDQVVIDALMPLAEIVIDFYDRLKNISSGFASFDYELLDFRRARVVKLDILIAKNSVDALSQIVIEKNAPFLGRRLVAKLKEVIPRQQFEVPIQAVIGSKIVARADVPAFRKDVTAKLYGGDRTRKDKLLEAQKKGKKRMKMVGRVEIPQEAFLSILKM